MKNQQIMAGYFRTWRDKAADPSVNAITFSDLPDNLDIALVFPWDTPLESPFWEALKTVYVPVLHAVGTKVVITQGIETLLDKKYPNTPEGYEAYADMIMNTYIIPFNLDGLDIDYERSLSKDEFEKTVGIFSCLAMRLGPLSGTEKLLILDTNRDGHDPLFQSLAPMIDYLFLQAYGRSPSSLTGTYHTFKDVIPASKFVPGFSFYEENGARWNDISDDRISGRAYEYADWQPDNGEIKGGLFSYAIDRDIPEKTDQIIAADFFVTRQLIARMNPV